MTICEGWRGVDDILPGCFKICMLSITCTHVHVAWESIIILLSYLLL